MISALVKLRESSQGFSPTEKEIARFILDNPSVVENLSIRELARTTFCSPSTIVRMCTHTGFRGYKEFRTAIVRELACKDQSKREERKELENSNDLQSIVNNITYKNIMSLEDTMNLIDLDVVRRCIRMIQEARVVYMFGMGASLCAAKDAYLKFLRLNKLSVVNEDWHSQLLQARNASPSDLGIVFSYSGNTVEVIECMKALKQNKTPIIAITRCVSTPVSQMADENLYTTANESIFRSGAMSSRISQLNIVDILYTALASERVDSSVDQISKTHIHKPGEQEESV